MPTDKEWRDALQEWQKAVAERDTRILGLKAQVDDLQRRKSYLEDRNKVLEGLARMLLLQARLPGTNDELVKKIVEVLPYFQEAFARLQKEEGIQSAIDVIIPLPPEAREEAEAKQPENGGASSKTGAPPAANDKGGKPKA